MSDNMEIRFGETVRLDLGNAIPVPVRDYLLMINKPQINGHELTGNLVIRVGDLENDAGYLQTETDPTVPGWAKEPQKPTYTAEEVHALPDTTFIPSRESDLEHDRGYYIKPIDGIPLADLQSGLIPTKVSQLENDSRFYVKPVGGIPASDIEAALIRLINGKMNSSLKGAPNGVAELDQNGMVPSHQLPSYVDDVKSYTSIAFFPAVGEDDKIYVDKSTNLQYRWGGTDVGYITIGTSLALGETANTAYRGDRGKAAYDHAMAKGAAFVSGLYKIETNAEGHIVSAVPVAKADITALGIPGSMPDVSGFYTKPVTGIPASDLADGVIPTVPVTDVRVNGTSILQDGVANIPVAGSGVYGAVRVNSDYGVRNVVSSGHSYLGTNLASDDQVKGGTNNFRPIVPGTQHKSVFYALSKLAGVDLANGSDVVGAYPQSSKTAIQAMLGIEADIPLIEEVSGASPSITGMPNVRYICGTCSLLTITPPASGSIVVRFTSGSTATLLTVPNTVKFPVWFDPTSLEADTTYEIIITDGVYGGVMSWA